MGLREKARAVILLGALGSVVPDKAPADTVVAPTDSRTFLVDLRVGSPWAGDLRAAAARGYDLADGTARSMRAWYSSRTPTLEVSLMTQLSRRTGLLWGLSTGESGRKYTVFPAVSFGVIHQVPVGRRSHLTFRAETRLGGGIRERTCTADYGEIGGVQEVNCRLAATLLPPKETLEYLLDREGWRATTLSVTYQILF